MATKHEEPKHEKPAEPKPAEAPKHDPLGQPPGPSPAPNPPDHGGVVDKPGAGGAKHDDEPKKAS
jgi:hypothetical protein